MVRCGKCGIELKLYEVCDCDRGCEHELHIPIYIPTSVDIGGDSVHET